jgi:hypothetical protein
MDMAVVFEWFGQIRAAAQAHEPRQREIWTRWAMLSAISAHWTERAD